MLADGEALGLKGCVHCQLLLMPTVVDGTLKDNMLLF
jgi:hypothetical protein